MMLVEHKYLTVIVLEFPSHYFAEHQTILLVSKLSICVIFHCFCVKLCRSACLAIYGTKVPVVFGMCPPLIDDERPITLTGNPPLTQMSKWGGVFTPEQYSCFLKVSMNVKILKSFKKYTLFVLW